MKRVLIISPYFPPVNGADMQRVRMSLPYFKVFGWEAEVVCVEPKFTEMLKDDLLCESVPDDTPVHTVRAFPKKYTAKLGLGSIALRSLWFYRKKVDALLKRRRFDLIYFSTTQFPVCILGPYWKKKFDIPYVIDMQDPWHSDYYRNKPKNERPPKYWFSSRLNKWLEPMAMKSVSGLISVSAAYIETLKRRYANIKHIPAAVIPFAAFDPDAETAIRHQAIFPELLDKRFINIVYIGRGGNDMHSAITPFFAALKQGLDTDFETFKNVRLHFIGTSYASVHQAKPSIKPLADKMGLSDYILEQPQRIGFFHTLNTLQKADALFIPGSDDAAYTASKTYPYITAQKPLLAIFHPESSAAHVLNECTTATVCKLDNPPELICEKSFRFISDVARGKLQPAIINQHLFEKHKAPEMVRRQVELFDTIIL